ncbi:MAG: hypothetical protein ABI946_04095 [Chthoniobacterales bacterium]
MKLCRFVLFVLLSVKLAMSAETSLTIYSTKFGVVRETLPLDLRKGENDVRTSRISSNLDPGTVLLRDPSGKVPLRILEQKLRAQPLNKDAMLAHFENQIIPFRVYRNHDNQDVPGKIVRAASPGTSSRESIIEIEGHFEFDEPGTPLFPSLPPDAVLAPELSWKIAAEQAVKLDGELTYLTDGLSWNADYNVVVSATGDFTQLIGLMSIKNDTTQTFENAAVKIVAGDVNRVGAEVSDTTERMIVSGAYVPAEEAEEGTAMRRAKLDEYYAYTMQRPVTLEHGASVQVEFMHANGVKASRSFVYVGSEPRLSYDPMGAPNLNPRFGADSNSSVVVLSEFMNDRANHLGVPLPRGRFHFYDQTGDRLEFTGDAVIRDTPAGEMVGLVSGSAFDLIGERRQTDFLTNPEQRTFEESFEIKLRNHRKEAVEIRVIEHPSRWHEWEVTAKSDDFKKVDGRTIEFRVPVKAGEEKTVSYTIRYSRLPEEKDPAGVP